MKAGANETCATGKKKLGITEETLIRLRAPEVRRPGPGADNHHTFYESAVLPKGDSGGSGSPAID